MPTTRPEIIGRTAATRRRPRWLVPAAMLLVVFTAPLVEKRFFTCAVCGRDRQTVSAGNVFLSESQSETACSRWYDRHVELRHEHMWARGTWTQTYAMCGIRWHGRQIAGDADGPLVRFGSGVRHLMYEKCPDPLVLRDAFVRLSRWDGEGTAARQEQAALEQTLTGWVDADLAGPCPLAAR